MISTSFHFGSPVPWCLFSQNDGVEGRMNTSSDPGSERPRWAPADCLAVCCCITGSRLRFEDAPANFGLFQAQSLPWPVCLLPSSSFFLLLPAKEMLCHQVAMAAQSDVTNCCTTLALCAEPHWCGGRWAGGQRHRDAFRILEAKVKPQKALKTTSRCAP